MKKILLIPDSFKGTMSSAEVCALMEEAVSDILADTQTVSIPVADGGEGSVEAFLEFLGGEKKMLQVKNPFFEEIESFYGILNTEKSKFPKTAVIEMAACAGLPLAFGRLDPSLTTTYGVGQLIEDALKNGCENIILGLGGSATNDGGCGAAVALGVRFFDKSGKSFVPVGGTLKDICNIDISGLNPLLKEAKVTTMCDIDNPLFGKNGAAYIFAPQKGANPAMVEELDKGLKHLASIVEKCLGADLNSDTAKIAGTGAAGGMGYGNLIFFGSELKMGIETVLDTVQFDRQLEDASFVFTGEGKLDSQSLRGKVVVGVARRAKKKGVPVIAIVGDAENKTDDVYKCGVNSVFSINRLAVPFSEAKKTAKEDLLYTMKDVLRLIKIGFN
ncbi:MAG: glycerate kinase [Treponema sp.]|nr:MAG: glycerate kinase [Treponema sp.]